MNRLTISATCGALVARSATAAHAAGQVGFPPRLLRAPHSNDAQHEIRASRWYAGYSFVVVRGRDAAISAISPYRNQADDGPAIDAWMAGQPRRSGGIAPTGDSERKFTELSPTVRASKHLLTVPVDRIGSMRLDRRPNTGREF